MKHGKKGQRKRRDKLPHDARQSKYYIRKQRAMGKRGTISIDTVSKQDKERWVSGEKRANGQREKQEKNRKEHKKVIASVYARRTLKKATAIGCIRVVNGYEI